MNSSSEKLSNATRKHYESLISSIGDDYIDYRWKRNPVSFSHYSQTQKSIEFVFEEIGHPAERLLEIGCGPGTWTDICLKNCKEMSLVDISSEMLKLVRERFLEAPLDLFCGDFLDESIIFPHAFDIVFSARAVEYMDDKGAMVAKSAKYLKFGGYLIIITKNPGWMDKKRQAKVAEKASQTDIHSDWISWSVLEDHYRQQGLTDIITYPVCLGSYYSPFRNTIGIKLCDLIQNFTYRKAISPHLDFLAESYMTIGRKPVED